MNTRLLALFALALPASAAWTYVADAGAWNGNGDKKYSGYVTDGATWTIFVLDLGDGNWQLGAGTWGVDGGNGGSCQAGTTAGCRRMQEAARKARSIRKRFLIFLQLFKAEPVYLKEFNRTPPGAPVS